MRFFTTANNYIARFKEEYKSFNFKDTISNILLHSKKNLCTIIEKTKNLEKTNFDLGIYHYLNENISDAILRFKMVKFFNPKNMAALYYIGRCYQEIFKYHKARPYLEEYLNSSDQQFIEETKYCLNIINYKSDEIKSIPLSIIQAIANKTGYIYYKRNLENRDIMPKQLLFSHMFQILMDQNKPFGNNVLDLGCGGGALARLCRSHKIANNIIGIDISEQMINISSSLAEGIMSIYNNTELISYQSYLQDTKIRDFKFDVIFASDLISYNADLEFLFEKSLLVSKESTLFGMTFKTTDANNIEFKYAVEQFYFAPEYVKNIAETHGWKVVKEDNTSFSNQEPGKVIIFSAMK